MTLDEAIQHCEEVIKKNKSCKECAEDHRQLAEWLKELKKLREQTRLIPASEKFNIPDRFGYENLKNLYYMLHGMASSEGFFDDARPSVRAKALGEVLEILKALIKGTQ